MSVGLNGCMDGMIECVHFIHDANDLDLTALMRCSSKRCAIKTLYTTRIGQRYYLQTLKTDVFYCISCTTLTSVFFQLY